MLSTAPFYFQQFHKDGEPLSGGKLYTYVGGSTNAPKATYVDANGAAASPNPIILSSQGICPQFWCESGLYKFVLTDANGVEVASRDYVDGIGGGAAITGDHKVMVNDSDTADYLGNKVYADGGLVVQEVEVDPGVYNLHIFPDLSVLQAKPVGPAGGDLSGTYPDPIVKQLTGIEAALLPIDSDFTFSTTPAGTGIGPGRQFLAGVEVRCWVAMGFDGHLRWTRNDFASTTLDAGLWSRGIGSNWNCIRFLYMPTFSSWAWVAGDGYHGRIFYALHVSSNYNLDGTIKSSAWSWIDYRMFTHPSNLGDISQGMNSVSCFVGNDHVICRTADFSSFTAFTDPDPSENYGGISTDNYGVWLVLRRDTGTLLESTDNGLTWANIPLISVDGLVASHLPIAHGELWGSLNYGYGKWLAAVYNTGSGRISYAYSSDRRIWTTYTSPSAASFFSAAFDGRKWFATNPETSPPIWQLLFSEIPAHKRLICEDGLIANGTTFLPDLANAQVLATDRNGLLVAQSWLDLSSYASASEYRVGGTVVVDSNRNVKGASLWSGGAIRIDALGDGFLRNLSISGLTNGAIPLVSTAGGLLAGSAVSEDATYVRSSKPLSIDNTLLRIGPAAGQATLGMDTASGNAAVNVAYTAGSARWAWGKTGDAESGANAGSDWFMRAFSDAGTLIDTPMQIARVAGGAMILSRPIVSTKQVSQWASEPVTSGCYVKTTDTTIGPSAAAKASLLNGGVLAGGFAAVTDPAGRWNQPKAKNRVELAGVISSAANQAITFELYRNGVVSATLTVPARTYGSNTPWRLVIKQTVRVNGTSGQVRVLMRFYCTADNTNSAASCYQMDATLTGIDLTASQTWDVVCTIPNNASNQITCQDAEKVG